MKKPVKSKEQLQREIDQIYQRMNQPQKQREIIDLSGPQNFKMISLGEYFSMQKPINVL